MGEPGECKNSVLYALEQGYRMIDTAMAYGNEDEVGQAIRESGIPREEIFVVTKLRRPHSCLLYTSPSPRDRTRSRMPSSA